MNWRVAAGSALIFYVIASFALFIFDRFETDRRRQGKKLDKAKLAIESGIRERKQLEDRARFEQAQRLESLGILAGGIAHDFNNMLSVVLGNASLAQPEVDPTSTVAKNLRAIQRAAVRGADLCDQILSYAGHAPPDSTPLDINATLRESTALLQVALSKKADLRWFLAEGLPAVRVDRAQMHQVLMNLAINASEALGEAPGHIEIRTGVQEYPASALGEHAMTEDLPGGRYVFLEVVDSGEGMDGFTRDRIFEPFFSTKFAGRGLGLASVLGIVRIQRGGVQVESLLGQGTTVRVLLPADTNPAVASGTARERSPAFMGAGTVLVIEDEADNRNMLEQSLVRRGFRVLMATNGREGVEVFASHADDVDLVLTDLTMPVLNGREALAEIHHLRPSVPTIVMSGYSEDMAALEAESDSVYLHKPFDQNELARALERALAK